MAADMSKAPPPTAATDPSAAEKPWHAAFPTPSTTAPLINRADTLKLLDSPELLVVDVRRTDYEGGSVAGSLNLPAHSFYANRAVLYDLTRRAGVKKVAFYCGSSNGRGPRCAAWFADYIKENGDENLQSLTLEGGIKGWVKAGPEYVQRVEGYEEEYWKQF